MNQVYNQLLMKQKQNEIMQQQGRQKYEYDSDEDTEVNIRLTSIHKIATNSRKIYI